MDWRLPESKFPLNQQASQSVNIKSSSPPASSNTFEQLVAHTINDLDLASYEANSDVADWNVTDLSNFNFSNEQIYSVTGYNHYPTNAKTSGGSITDNYIQTLDGINSVYFAFPGNNPALHIAYKEYPSITVKYFYPFYNEYGGKIISDNPYEWTFYDQTGVRVDQPMLYTRTDPQQHQQKPLPNSNISNIPNEVLDKINLGLDLQPSGQTNLKAESSSSSSTSTVPPVQLVIVESNQQFDSQPTTSSSAIQDNSPNSLQLEQITPQVPLNEHSADQVTIQPISLESILHEHNYIFVPQTPELQKPTLIDCSFPTEPFHESNQVDIKPPMDVQVTNHELNRNLPNDVLSSAELAAEQLASIAQKVKQFKFPTKLWKLTTDPQFPLLTWSPNGSAIRIKEVQLEPTLRFFFRSSKFSSFLRQLHLYGFRKESYSKHNNTQHILSEYFHKNFHRDHPEWLKDIKRFYESSKPKPNNFVRQFEQQPEASSPLSFPLLQNAPMVIVKNEQLFSNSPPHDPYEFVDYEHYYQ